MSQTDQLIDELVNLRIENGVLEKRIQAEVNSKYRMILDQCTSQIKDFEQFRIKHEYSTYSMKEFSKNYVWCPSQLIEDYPTIADVEAAEWYVFFCTQRQQYNVIPIEKTNPELPCGWKYNGADIKNFHAGINRLKTDLRNKISQKYSECVRQLFLNISSLM